MADQSEEDAIHEEAEGEVPRIKVNMVVAGGILGLLVLIAAAVFFSFRFVESERARALQEWQTKLGIVADSRVADVNEWVDANIATIAELSENQSLQLYMSELTEAGDPSRIPDGAASAGYLRNLLVATSDRNGFSPPPPSQETNSNVERLGVSGIALIDSKGNAIVGTPEMPPVADRLKAINAKALAESRHSSTCTKGPPTSPRLGSRCRFMGSKIRMPVKRLASPWAFASSVTTFSTC